MKKSLVVEQNLVNYSRVSIFWQSLALYYIEVPLYLGYLYFFLSVHSLCLMA